ncbi:hypothetical protein LZ31DRAFT_549300 [Colletotrichum somersetense]|nr:hypothetical protein LZ31DRAFT_549300 [Colletotrichum somersetense]
MDPVRPASLGAFGMQKGAWVSHVFQSFLFVVTSTEMWASAAAAWTDGESSWAKARRKPRLSAPSKGGKGEDGL